MMQDKKVNTYELVYFVCFFSLLLINTLVRSEWTETFFYAEVSLYFTFAAMYFYLLKTLLFPVKAHANYRIHYLAVILLLLYVSYSFVSTEFAETEVYVTLGLHLVFIAAAVRTHFREEQIKVAGAIFGLAVAFFFIHWLMSGLPLQYFKSIYRNENYLAVLLFSFLYFQVLAAHYSRRIIRTLFHMSIALNILLIIVTGARSVLIGIGMIVITAWCIKYYPVIMKKLLSIVMLLNLLFVGLYVSLSFTSFGRKLNEISYELTEKNLFSGRQEIWDAVTMEIVKKPFFGHGLGVRAYEVAATDLTAHNMYLQLFLEFGLIGFILFFIILVSIWRLLLKQFDTFAAKCSLCFMTGILVYNTFELTLFQNNYSIAVFQWLIMAVGIGFIQKESSPKKHSRRQARRMNRS